jgi:hypothetical protein
MHYQAEILQSNGGIQGALKRKGRLFSLEYELPVHSLKHFALMYFEGIELFRSGRMASEMPYEPHEISSGPALLVCVLYLLSLPTLPFSATISYAQETAGGMQGTVKDGSGAVLS